MRGADKVTQTDYIYGYLVYNSFLTADTVQDIVAVVTKYRFGSPIPDSVFVVLYKRSDLVQGRIAYPSEVVFLKEQPDDITWTRYYTQGDWRGTGSEDLITAEPETKTYFYYATERPFSLQRFAQSLLYDTLISQFDEPRISRVVGGQITMQALPKSSSDRSNDLVLTLYLDGIGQVIHFFRGHSEFGTQRLTSDSASSRIYPFKGSLRDFIFDQKLQDMGDMTGTGNRVLYTSASQDGGFSTYHLFYVTGNALDDTADMVQFVAPRGRAWIDTITANGDNLQDVILGMPDFYRYEDLDKGKIGLGTIHLLYGSKKIPVKGLLEVNRESANASDLHAYPNPTSGAVTLTIDRVACSHLTVRLMDCIGREIESKLIPSITGSRMSVQLDYSRIQSGTYVLSVLNGEKLCHTHLIVL